MVTCVYSTNTEMANKFKSIQLGQKKNPPWTELMAEMLRNGTNFIPFFILQIACICRVARTF
jgi:hypothetical protein